MTEVLPPDAEVPVAVREPHPVRWWRHDVTYETRVQFEDGGVWAVSDRVLYEKRSITDVAGLGAVFAVAASSFRFIGRKRARYAPRP